MWSFIFLIGYLLAVLSVVLWFRKIKKRGEKISLGAKIFAIFIALMGPSVILSVISPSPSPAPEDSKNNSAVTYYIKPEVANVRECPSTSCKIIDTLSQNTELTFPEDLFEKYPDWAEVTFQDGRKGYVSKTTLSENSAPASQPPSSGGGTSSKGGITIGPWNDLRITTGEFYEFYFCEPLTAISGATCGGLADKATNPRGGRPPYSFVKSSGFLPPGMALELNGTLKGAPTEAGTYRYRLCAKDLYGGEGCQDLAVTVTSKAETPKSDPTPVAEDADFVNIESTTCQAKGYSMPGNPNSWIVYRITVTGTGGGGRFGSLGFYCDARYGGGPCHNQFASCDSWTNSPQGYQSCDREVGQPAVTRWTYWAEGAMNRDIGFNFGVKAGSEDPIYKNIPCGD